MKTCCRCKINKAEDEFGKNKQSSDGLHYSCKACCRLSRLNNPDYAKNYHENNKVVLKEKKKQYYLLNSDKFKAKTRKYRKDNPQKTKYWNLQNYEKNKVKNYQKRKERIKNDPLFKMKCYLRNRVCFYFKKGGFKKVNKTEVILGTSYENAKSHIEQKFKDGMTWDNYGKWHIDHIVPLCTAKSEEELKQLCHYTNLQPLWEVENLSKGKNINYGYNISF